MIAVGQIHQQLLSLLTRRLLLAHVQLPLKHKIRKENESELTHKDASGVHQNPCRKLHRSLHLVISEQP